MCRWTACSTSKDSLFSTSFTGYPSTVTFYEVQLQLLLLLLLHQRHNFSEVMQEFKVGWFLVWAILPSGGRGHQSLLSGGTKACVCSRGVFCFLFLYFLSFFPPFPKPPPLTQWDSAKFPRIKKHQKAKWILKKIFRLNHSIPFEGKMYLCVFVMWIVS